MAIFLHLGGGQDLLVLWMRDKSLPCLGQHFNKIEGKEWSNPAEQVTRGEAVSSQRAGWLLRAALGTWHCLGQQWKDGMVLLQQGSTVCLVGDSWCEWQMVSSQTGLLPAVGYQTPRVPVLPPWPISPSGSCRAAFCGGTTALPQDCPVCSIYRHDGQDWHCSLKSSLKCHLLNTELVLCRAF